MVDREKVLKGLEDIQKHLDIGYSFAISWKSELIRDALILLKEQEVKPHRCKECSYRRKDDWCDECRRIVKESDYCSFGSWEGR